VVKKYYGIVRHVPPYIVVDADSLKEAKATLTKEFGSDNILLVKRATPADLDFIEWCKASDKAKEQRQDTTGTEPGDTGEQGLARSGPRC
jgi:hypothetical protein